MNTALYRRRAANINSTIRNGSTQSWSCFKQFKEKLQNDNGEIVILFVDEKIYCALDHNTPRSLFLSRKVTLPCGAKSHSKNVLGFVFLLSIWHKFNIRFEMGLLNTLELEIRESKDFERTARRWKGKKAIRKKIYKLKKIKLYKEIEQNYNY